MSNSEFNDPYNGIAVIDTQDFELRGDGLAVPLSFKPDAAFVVHTLLKYDEEFSRDLIVDDPDFHELSGAGHLAPTRFARVMSDLRFTFGALRSGLILVRRQGSSNMYQRNPDYGVVDESGIMELHR